MPKVFNRSAFLRGKLEAADNDVFSILGYDGGKMDRDPGFQPFRDTSSKSHRPDLYRLFVEWSTSSPRVVGTKNNSDPFSFGVINIHTAPLDTLCLDLLTSKVLVKDLMALDTMLTMSPTFWSPKGVPCVLQVSSRLSHAFLVSSTLSRKKATPSSACPRRRVIWFVSCFVLWYICL